METKKRYYTEFHIAGVQYHDADLVWDRLAIGTRLRLVREDDNKYDTNAIAIVYRDECHESDTLIGYVPRDENELMALLMDSGWKGIFDCRLSRINPEAHYEQQLSVKIRVNENPDTARD